jgi:lysophospholipid acyltransferase (LPLAT)-like uncharacterized protein
MSSLKRIAGSPWVQKTVGVVAAEYLRLVWKTSRFAIDPPDLYETGSADRPIILAMWHGQHFMVPFVRRGYQAKVLISRHRDGEINAIAAERLGVGTIRGSGDHERRFDRKGGVSAFRQMLDALEEGFSMALTADVPKVSRVAGRGIIMLARESGRPIYPVAVATSRRIELRNWDRSAVNLPFSRGAICGGHALRVPPDADEDAIELCRQRLQSALNEVTERAYALVDRTALQGEAARRA